MGRIKSVNTGLEGRLETLLLQCDLKGYLRSPKHIIGKPDFVFARKRLALFLDSCFWHGCRWHLRMPKSNLRYWMKKIKGNMKRDSQQRRELRKGGWRVIRIWEHELNNPARLLKKIQTVASFVNWKNDVEFGRMKYDVQTHAPCALSKGRNRKVLVLN